MVWGWIGAKGFDGQKVVADSDGYQLQGLVGVEEVRHSGD